jgi:hypothetical protein
MKKNILTGVLIFTVGTIAGTLGCLIGNSLTPYTPHYPITQSSEIIAPPKTIVPAPSQKQLDLSALKEKLKNQEDIQGSDLQKLLDILIEAETVTK